MPTNRALRRPGPTRPRRPTTIRAHYPESEIRPRSPRGSRCKRRERKTSTPARVSLASLGNPFRHRQPGAYVETAEGKVDDARHVLEVTRRMHVIASTAEGATLTLVELERLAEEQIATTEDPRARSMGTWPTREAPV
jgi:hypothetical protein